ncbi:MAG TPA: cation transporter [Sphingobacteriaceae bacterium]|nr:cation transporter [Sphingobacteriaceae bacterium]
MSQVQTVKVIGMSCNHCRAAVEKALSGLPGVEEVNVDLEAGEAKIRSRAGVDDEAIRQAVQGAGYQVGA